MKTLRMLGLIGACALLPATARADDGGWWEWLQGLSGPKLHGLGTDMHLFCVDKDGTPFRCERLFRLLTPGRPYDDIKHQFDIRLSLYWNYGMQFTDASAKNTPGEIMAAKVMAMYYNRVHPMVSVGGGAGVIPFFGSDFDKFARGIVTPASVIVSPFTGGGKWGKAFYFRVEASYITQGFSAAKDFNNTSTYVASGEWNPSYAIGFDFRRK
ncbi:MAG: hypothetical protein HY048_19970 [Acidobacteria bacterium]|nr:hypothetical protein [Acidobacteriota bacterium]